MCAILAAAMLISAYHPEEVDDWFMENAAVFLLLGALIATYRRLPLSDTSYLCLVVFLSIHEWGAHYKYSDVPLGEWMKPWFGTTRNSYDRVIHLSYGVFCGYPLQELAMRTGIRNQWRSILPVVLILAFSAVYEIAEAAMASILSPLKGEEFVGMQGDFWDAQKDMLLAGAGAVVATAAVSWIRRRKAVAAQSAPIAMAARMK